MIIDSQTPDAHNDIYSPDCIGSMKIQMAAMKANSEGIKATYVGHSVDINPVLNPWFEEANEIDTEVISKLKMRPFTYGIDFGFNTDNV